MSDSYTHDIRVLNELITTTLDSVDGYSEAAKDAEEKAARKAARPVVAAKPAATEKPAESETAAE